MDTTRVDITYRPLRIGWAVQSGDMSALRQAVRLSYALWGGCFNPILVVDHEASARDLVEAFRVDMLWPISTTNAAKDFPKLFPHLITPFLGAESIVSEDGALVLDMHNALAYLRDEPEWKHERDGGITLFNWAPEDPLADVFLMQFGDFPSPEEVKLNYRELLMSAATTRNETIENTAVLPAALVQRRSLAFVSRFGVTQQRDGSNWQRPGVYVGDGTDFEDLVCFWNLQAADIPLWFIDRGHINRYRELIPAWTKRAQGMPASWRSSADGHLFLWSRGDPQDDVKLLGTMPLLHMPVSTLAWSGINSSVPPMEFDSTSVLGVVGADRGIPRVSFTYSNKPFCDDVWFHNQHLVASISCIGGLPYDAQFTLSPPFVPELNEFYARAMAFDYSKLRVEPDRIGLVIDACAHDGFLDALPFGDLMAQVFQLAGYEANLSAGGLIVRQLITQLDGLQGGRVFKIPGVRRMIRSHGPGTHLSKPAALQLIGGKDPDNPAAKFADHKRLFIEQRSSDTELTPSSVLGYLVEKGLFRIGAELCCPYCRMASWVSLDLLKEQVVCEMCGHGHNAARQTVDTGWSFRRSGVLGAERHAQGAIPVLVTLQQLDTTLHGVTRRTVYSPPLDLKPLPGAARNPCEIDLVWALTHYGSTRTVVVIGECKDRWTIDDATIGHLREVADALPSKRFEVYILLSKLCPFTPEEIARARSLNNGRRLRVILLTARELEPYSIFERTKKECAFTERGHAPADLAWVTSQIYFENPVPVPPTGSTVSNSSPSSPPPH